MRTDYAVKNVKSTIIMYCANYILKFVQRSVFLYTLPLAYLGLNALFSDIIMFLSVTEMGVGTAIAYSLYKPLSTGDITTVKAIMSLFRKVYHFIGYSILVLGIFITPFLDNWVQNNNIAELEYFFLVILLTDAIGYFFAYKWVLLTADQKGYIFNYYHCIFLTILSVLQIIFLLLFKSYWSFVLVMFIIRMVENYYIEKKIDVIYPFLQEKNTNEIAVEIKQNIVNNIKALLINKIAVIVSNSSFSIIASKYIGLTVVGLYSNYSLIISAVATFCAQIFKSLTAVIGNFLVTGEDKNKIKVFNFLFYMSAWLNAIIFNCLYIGLNDLISIWIGQNMLLQKNFVFLMLLLFYFTFMQNMVTLFKESAGLYWQERYRPVAEVILNISFSIYLVQTYGAVGILFANLISKLLTSFWIEPYVLFNNAFKISVREYFYKYLKYSVLIFFITLLNIKITKYLTTEVTLFLLLIKFGICFIVANLLWIAVFKNCEEMIYFKQVLKNKFGIKII